ncbi:unnamed protein product [Rodentolepis nana]|uniref:PDZ domain-containing protein n=1 Tax=Rodentolepis nana TaxID=102285 RepID=A0A0R3TRW9_RODNA|nr:unnamed protein product [Rodentolepis nana]
MLYSQNKQIDTDFQIPSEDINQLSDADPSREFPMANSSFRDGSFSPGDWEYVEVVISRPHGQNQSFGFSIAGGYDAQQENGDSSVFITRIAPGGIAEADGRLQPFDRIVSVNGTDLNYVSNQEAVRILKESGDTLAMIIRRYIGPEPGSSGIESISPITNTNIPPSNDDQTTSDDVYFEVNLVKPSENIGLGFTIAGGQMIEGFPEGIYVTKLTPGGLAEQDGQIQPGDRLIQVNGQELGNASHEMAVQLLRNAGTHVHLVLLRPLRSTVSQNFTPSLASDDTIVDTKKR